MKEKNLVIGMENFDRKWDSVNHPRKVNH